MDALICGSCGKTYRLTEPVWCCTCGGLLNIQFQPEIDPKKIMVNKPNLWRYRDALPVPKNASLVSFEEGFTPLLSVQMDGKKVWIKQDHLFQTGSYKDRGSAVLITMAKYMGIERVVEDSSGNAGCSIAAYCAAAGISCEIYVPKDTAPAKLAQIEMYGAKLVLVPGTREDTAAAVMNAAETTYYASHSWNPFFFQGTKTFAYEVCEQLGWQSPDVVVLPAGNGTLILGTWLGFQDLLATGVIDRIPRLVAVQAENCAPLAAAFRSGKDTFTQIKSDHTLAEGIAIANPVRGTQIIQTVRASGGSFVIVNEPEIEQALRELATKGFYIEPTSAAVMAGVKKVLRQTRSDEIVVSVFTGHGLKSTEKILRL